MLKGARLSAIALLIVALLLDASGRFLNRPPLWIAGAHATSIGVSLGVAVACLALIEGLQRGQLLWLCGLGAFTLARVLRGAAGVPPDSPLLVLSAIGSTMMVAAHLRQRSFVPQPSPCPTPDPTPHSTRSPSSRPTGEEGEGVGKD